MISQTSQNTIGTRFFLCFIFISTVICTGCSNTDKVESDNWCGQIIRSALSTLEEIPNNSAWFKTYKVGEGVFAIAEPYNYQEIISYLILGDNKALLFDTGMGMGSIAGVAKELTKLPITVLNSHTHYDHIGGNHEFENILAMNTQYTIERSEKGIEHSRVSHEVTPEALCLDKLPGLDTANYYIKPFQISRLITDEYVIDLGNRTLEVISVPGHTPDAISLYDKTQGYLFTGDTFYEGPIWLFDPETDLTSYQESIQRLLDRTSDLKTLFPAHNTPIAKPERLVALVNAFDQVLDGTKKPTYSEGTEHGTDEVHYFEFEHFSFFISQDKLREKGIKY